MDPNLSVLIAHSLGYQKMRISHSDATDYIVLEIDISGQYCLSVDKFDKLTDMLPNKRMSYGPKFICADSP